MNGSTLMMLAALYVALSVIAYLVQLIVIVAALVILVIPMALAAATATGVTKIALRIKKYIATIFRSG
jgi:hypothetical protein